MRSPKGMAHNKDYTDYITSDAWYAVREKAFAFHGKDCKRCGFKANHIHHKTYKNFKHENVEADLVPLCSDCHKTLHKFVKKNAYNLFHGTEIFLSIPRDVKIRTRKLSKNQRRRLKKNNHKRLHKHWGKTNSQYKFEPRSPDIPINLQLQRLVAYKKQQPRPSKKPGAIDYAKMAALYGITIEEARTIA